MVKGYLDVVVEGLSKWLRPPNLVSHGNFQAAMSGLQYFIGSRRAIDAQATPSPSSSDPSPTKDMPSKSQAQDEWADALILINNSDTTCHGCLDIPSTFQATKYQVEGTEQNEEAPSLISRFFSGFLAFFILNISFLSLTLDKFNRRMSTVSTVYRNRKLNNYCEYR